MDQRVQLECSSWKLFYNTEKTLFKLKMIKEIHPIKGEDHMREYVNWKNFLNKLN